MNLVATIIFVVLVGVIIFGVLYDISHNQSGNKGDDSQTYIDRGRAKRIRGNTLKP